MSCVPRNDCTRFFRSNSWGATRVDNAFGRWLWSVRKNRGSRGTPVEALLLRNLLGLHTLSSHSGRTSPMSGKARCGLRNCAQRMVAYIRAAVAGCGCHKVTPNFGGGTDVSLG